LGFWGLHGADVSEGVEPGRGAEREMRMTLLRSRLVIESGTEHDSCGPLRSRCDGAREHAADYPQAGSKEIGIPKL